MSRPVHFEIHASDPARACTFYGDALGWTFEDWSEYAGSPYFGVTTGPEDAPGINGAIKQRTGDPPAAGAPTKRTSGKSGRPGNARTWSTPAPPENSTLRPLARRKRSSSGFQSTA